MINLRTIAALAPVGAGFWLITHPGLASSLIAAGTVGAAVVEHTLAKQRAERAAAKDAKKEAAIEDKVSEALDAFRTQTAPQALPRPATVIDYTAAGREVTRASKRMV